MKTKYKIIVLLITTLFSSLSYANHTNRSKFKCSLTVRVPYGRPRTPIDQKNIPVILGYSETKRDLQPIFVDKHIEKVLMSKIRFMGNVYVDPASNKPTLLLGMYQMGIRFQNSYTEDLWHAPENDPLHNWYARPITEATSTSGAAEIKSASFFAGKEIQFSCKNMD